MTFKVKIATDADIDGLTAEKTQEALKERSEMLHKVFEEAGETLDPSKVTLVEFKDGVEMGTWVRNVNEELTKLGKRATAFDQAEKARQEAEKWGEWGAPAGAGDKPEKPKIRSIGQAFVESDALQAAKDHRDGATFQIEGVDAKGIFLERKTEFTTSAGWAPESTRTGRVVLDEQRELEVTDFIPSFPTNQAAVVYMEETTFTNNAAERSESGAYVESALALTQRTSTVRSIGTSLPVTDEQLEDVEGVRAYLDQRLGFMVRQRLDGEILAGGGTPPDLTGTLNVASHNTQAKGRDSTPDAVYKAMDLVRVTGRAIPNVVFFNPTDWQPVRLLKTADGVYIWGSPSDAGPARIWGLPVVLTTAMTEGKALVGDYARFSGLHVRRGLEIQTGYKNDDFTDGRITIRAGLRVALVHYGPSAFTEITGL